MTDQEFLSRARWEEKARKFENNPRRGSHARHVLAFGYIDFQMFDHYAGKGWPCDVIAARVAHTPLI